MNIIAKDGQSLLDIAVQTGGHVETAVALCEANGISLTARLEEGMAITVPEPVAGGDSRVVELYRAHGVEPATDVSAEDMSSCPYGGIGMMGIELDFIVS